MQTTIPTPEELEKALLEVRGISEKEKNAFLHPEYSLGDLFKFKDMKKAVERIYAAVKNKETIGIYADYDCDGIPGAVILSDFFEKVGVQPIIYIPDRHDEGYGLSATGIESLAKSNVTLMITVDLGITGIAEVADANSRRIDCIITDHHAPIAKGSAKGSGSDKSEFPAAYAIIHPAKSTYRNSEPCGAGVAFYLICGFLQKYGEEFGIPLGSEKWLLDLVGFATLADMVPLTGENRMLAVYGLMVMRKTRRVGLQSLFLHNKLYAPALSEQDLTFTVAPRLNAASRMDTPMLAFDLLRTKDFVEAETLVRKLEEINSERKTLVARIVKEAHKTLESRELPQIVVIGNPDWRPAVLGLVATKLAEVYERSFFVWGNGGDGSIKGSCRMITTHHAAYLMQSLPDGMLLHAGGHQAAGGFSVAKEQIHFLEDELNKCLNKTFESQHDETIPEESKVPPIQLPLACVTERHLKAVRQFAPFGAGNPQPEFLFEDVTITNTKMFGKSKEHLELSLEDATGSATAFTFFAPGDMCETCITGATISFIGTLEPGFRGGARIRLQKLL